MAGWDDNSSSSPFGYAGPSTLPPTPVNRLGRVSGSGEREETREERKRRKKNFAAPSAALRQPAPPEPSLPSSEPTYQAEAAAAQGLFRTMSPFAAGPSSSLTAGPSTMSGGDRPALRNTKSMPLMSELAPSASSLAPPPTGGPTRRRSPLIQSVVEEEEDEPTDPNLLSPPPSSESEGHSFEVDRSRTSSISAGSVNGSGSTSRRKSGFGLGLGGVFSSGSSSAPKPLLSPPSSPSRKGSFSSVGTDGSSAAGGCGDEATPKASRFTLRRKSTAPAHTSDDASSVRSSALSMKSASGSLVAAPTRPKQRSMWDEPPSTSKVTHSPPPPAAITLKGTMRQPSFASRSLEPPIRPSAGSRLQSSSSMDSLHSATSATPSGPSASSPSPAIDPLSPFASQAPVFSRRGSASSGIILPVKASAPGSSSSSLRRLPSTNSLKVGQDDTGNRPQRFTFGSSSSLASLEPPPKLSSRFSYSSSRSGSPLASPMPSPSASVDSFSDALTHISASTPRTSPDGATFEDSLHRTGHFDPIALPTTRAGSAPTPKTAVASSAAAPAQKSADGGWRKAIRRMRSAFGGESTPKRTPAGRA